jgi:hypothetical protein
VLIDRTLWSWRLAAISVAVMAMICVSLDFTGVAILVMLGACILLIRCGRVATGGYANFTCVFLFFFMLYGLSGPIAAHFGEGLHAVFPRPYRTDEILLLIGLSVIGLAMGLSSSRRISQAITVVARPPLVAMDLYLLGFLFAAVASVMEVTNTLRAGGFETLVLGKAFVQSAVADMAWTLPADLVLLLAAAFLGLAIASQRAAESQRKRSIAMRVAAWAVIASPSILTYLTLGRRGVLLSVALALFVGLWWKLRIARLSRTFILIVALGYILMGAMFAARAQVGYGLATGDWEGLKQRTRTPEFWAFSLNPAAIEFGGTFGNINTYLLAGKSPLLWGQTYAEGLTVEIPRSVWPGKPQTATYVFRDTHFPELAERGSIAGTAFSSLLEALMNFGTAGIVLVYIAMGAGISLLEQMRARDTSALFFPLFYLLLLPEAMTFHRSAFDNPFFWPLTLALIGTASYLALRSFKTPIDQAQPA